MTTKTVLKRTNLRAYPTKAQEAVLTQAFGNSRFVWNYYTSIFNNKDIPNKDKIYPTIWLIGLYPRSSNISTTSFKVCAIKASSKSSALYIFVSSM